MQVRLELLNDELRLESVPVKRLIQLRDNWFSTKSTEVGRPIKDKMLDSFWAFWE